MSIALTAKLLDVAGVRHGFFTRQGGVSDGIYASLNGGQGSDDDQAKVAENRRRMAAFLGVAPDHFVSVYQIHSADVAIVNEPWTREARPKVDAMVTDRKGIAIGVSSADCGPLLFADPEAGIIGAAHAGWKGALTGIGPATVEAMIRLGAKRERICVALGMMISQANYQVGPEFVARFVDEDARYRRFFTTPDATGHAHFDLPGFNRHRLETAGITQIEDLARCTYADEELFYSYRRTTHRKEPDYGRHISAIALV
jgi:polyphenol oxidase